MVKSMKARAKHIISFSLFVILITSINSCTKSDPVGPNQLLKPGRRDYTWTVDTIKDPFVSLYSIWGDGPDNVWIVGPSADKQNRFFHHFSNKWYAHTEFQFYPYSIFGFDICNILAGAEAIYRYNGAVWVKEFEPKIDSLPYGGNVLFWGIRGNSPKNIWAVGYAFGNNKRIHGAVYHLDGEWKLSLLTKKHIQFHEVYPTGEQNKCLLWGVKHYPNISDDSSAIWEYDGKDSLKEIISTPFTDSECSWIALIGSELYLSINDLVFRYDKGKLNYFISSAELKNGSIIGGRNSSDLFIWNLTELQHYNGINTETLFKLPTPILVMNKVIALKNQIFFFAEDRITGVYYLVKGELKP